MAILLAILKALSAAFHVYKQERGLHNTPDMVKNKLAIAVQNGQDAVNRADEVLANPLSTPQQHAEALRQIRLAHS